MSTEADAPAAPETSASPEAAMDQHVAQSREAAMQAVREARAAAEAEQAAAATPTEPAKEEPKPTPERGEDGKFLPRDKKPGPAKAAPPKGDAAEPDAEPDPVVNVREVLKQRQERRNTEAALREQQQEAARLRAELEQQVAETKKQREWLEELRRNPVAAVRAAGWDTNQFVIDLAKEGTPEGQLARELVGSSRVDLQACKLEYSIVSPK